MYITVSDAAKKWNISDRMVRRYCIQGRIQGAYQDDEVWFIPEDAEKPARKIPEEPEKPAPKPQPPLAKKLRQQKTKKMFHGLYDYVQTNLTYSNGRMASNRLMLTQITEVFETDKVKTGFEPIKVDDLIEATDHMLCARAEAASRGEKRVVGLPGRQAAHEHRQRPSRGDPRRGAQRPRDPRGGGALRRDGDRYSPPGMIFIWHVLMIVL